MSQNCTDRYVGLIFSIGLLAHGICEGFENLSWKIIILDVSTCIFKTKFPNQVENG